MNVPAGFRQDKHANLERRDYTVSNPPSLTDDENLDKDIHLLSPISANLDLSSNHSPTVDASSVFV